VGWAEVSRQIGSNFDKLFLGSRNKLRQGETWRRPRSVMATFFRERGKVRRTLVISFDRVSGLRISKLSFQFRTRLAKRTNQR